MMVLGNFVTGKIQKTPRRGKTSEKKQDILPKGEPKRVEVKILKRDANLRRRTWGGKNGSVRPSKWGLNMLKESLFGVGLAGELHSGTKKKTMEGWARKPKKHPGGCKRRKKRKGRARGRLADNPIPETATGNHDRGGSERSDREKARACVRTENLACPPSSVGGKPAPWRGESGGR